MNEARTPAEDFVAIISRTAELVRGKNNIPKGFPPSFV